MCGDVNCTCKYTAQGEQTKGTDSTNMSPKLVRAILLFKREFLSRWKYWYTLYSTINCNTWINEEYRCLKCLASPISLSQMNWKRKKPPCSTGFVYVTLYITSTAKDLSLSFHCLVDVIFLSVIIGVIVDITAGVVFFSLL